MAIRRGGSLPRWKDGGCVAPADLSARPLPACRSGAAPRAASAVGRRFRPAGPESVRPPAARGFNRLA